MRHVWILVLGCGIAACSLTLIAQSKKAPETYKTRLSALPADAKTRPDLAGSGTVSAILTGSSLAVTGTFEGLKSPATVAHLHSAVAAGVRGQPIGDVTVSKATSGMITGSLDLNEKQLESLRKGGIYVQIHSEKAPDGVLWGWFQK